MVHRLAPRLRRFRSRLRVPRKEPQHPAFRRSGVSPSIGRLAQESIPSLHLGSPLAVPSMALHNARGTRLLRGHPATPFAGQCASHEGPFGFPLRNLRSANLRVRLPCHWSRSRHPGSAKPIWLPDRAGTRTANPGKRSTANEVPHSRSQGKPYDVLGLPGKTFTLKRPYPPCGARMAAASGMAGNRARSSRGAGCPVTKKRSAPVHRGLHAPGVRLSGGPWTGACAPSRFRPHGWGCEGYGDADGPGMGRQVVPREGAPAWR